MPETKTTIFQRIGALLSWFLAHPGWTGIGAIAGILALVLAWNSGPAPTSPKPLDPVPPVVKIEPQPPPPPPPCDVFVSEFTSQSGENGTFQKVLAKLDSEIVETIKQCKGVNYQGALQKLVDHYGEQRLLYLRAKRTAISDHNSATKGTSGGSKKVALRADCPNGMVVETSTVAKSGIGGCYINKTPEGQDFISGIVSQTGKGRSECTISAKCLLPKAAIQQQIKAEKIQLQAKAR
jgi:hypothetical protein